MNHGSGPREHNYQCLRLLSSSDLDETRQLVTEVFCAHRLAIAGTGALDYRHGHLRTGHLSFSQIGYGAEVAIDPGELGEFYLVQLPLAGRDLQCINGHELCSDHRRGTVHAPGEALQMRWSGDCRKLVVRFDRQALEQHAAGLFGRSLHQPLRFHPSMNLDHPACLAWHNTARHMFSELQRSPQLFELPLIRRQFEQTLMTTLLTWQPHNLHRELVDEQPRVLPRHVKLASDYMQANPEQAITVQRLAAVSGVSGRTLFAGFERFLGVSPMRYLRDVRLERVRQDLLNPGQPRSVTEIATRWGFFQLGRLATDYRKRFGEGPRETLARARS
jgi:AraC-like DNA-binding protein